MSKQDNRIRHKFAREKGKAMHELFMWYFKPIPISVTLLILFILFCCTVFIAHYDRNLTKLEIMRSGVLSTWSFCEKHFALILTNLLTNFTQWVATKKIQQSSGIDD